MEVMDGDMVRFGGSGVDADALCAIGNAAWVAGDHARAEVAWRNALIADPGHADSWGNLGLLLQTIGETDDALRCYMNAFALRPENSVNLVNMAYLHQAMGYTDHAIRFYERALLIDPESAEAQRNLGISLLYQFDFERGWPLTEARFKPIPGGLPVSIMREYPGVPLWDGEPTERLYIWSEQGLGDAMLYSTVLWDLADSGQVATVEVDPRLLPAYRRTFDLYRHLIDFVGTGASPLSGDAKAHVPIMSLAARLRPTMASFHDKQPWQMFRAERPHNFKSGKMNVAFSWRSFKPDRERFVRDRKSAPLSAFAELALHPRVNLVDVQYGPADIDRAARTFPVTRVDGLDALNDIEGLLSVLDGCDAIVTTSNVTAHLGGMLGIPTYLIYLRANAPFFYWQPDAHGRSLWYPNVQIVSGVDVTTWEDAVRLAMDRMGL